MLIFFDRRLVFLATPKAGSTAVEAALDSLANVAITRPEPLKHATVAEFEQYIRPWLETKAKGDRFTTVALMRNPLDWVRSWYRFRAHDAAGDPEHPMTGVNFESFVQAYIDPHGPDYARIGCQSDYLTNGARRTDRIFRYEDMAKFTEFLEDHLGCALTLPRVNVPPEAETAMSTETEARLNAALARDHALYDSLAEPSPAPS